MAVQTCFSLTTAINCLGCWSNSSLKLATPKICASYAHHWTMTTSTSGLALLARHQCVQLAKWSFRLAVVSGVPLDTPDRRLRAWPLTLHNLRWNEPETTLTPSFVKSVASRWMKDAQWRTVAQLLLLGSFVSFATWSHPPSETTAEALTPAGTEIDNRDCLVWQRP